MRTDEALLTLLRQVRHRLRAQAVVEGGVLGGTVGLVAWAAFVPWSGSVALAAALVAPVAGAGWAAVRKVPLSRCARVVDESLAARNPGEVRNGDRAYLAVALLGQEGPFAAAAIDDATRAAGDLAASGVAPWKRPRGLPGLAAAGALALVVGLAGPPRGPTAGQAGAQRTDASARPAPGVQQRAIADALRAAALLAPAEVARLASALGAAMERAAGPGGVSSGGEPSTGTGEASGTMEGRGLREALARVASSLGATESTRRAGDALARLDAKETKAALEELASRVDTMGSEARRETATALIAAANAAQASGADGQGEKPPTETQGGDERRLARDEKGEPGAGAEERPTATAPPDRQLRRLDRGMERANEEGRQEPRASGQPGTSGSPEPQPGRASEQPRGEAERPGEALGRAPSRLQRERGAAPGQGAAENRFERAARGEPDQGPAGQAAAAGATASSGERNAPTAGTANTPGTAPGGDRAGADPGGDPLGQRTELAGRGREVHARVASGEGASRATVIESGARGGFAQTSYRQVFRDYEAAAEEALDTTAVPTERRSLVRRYFHLIRPR